MKTVKITTPEGLHGKGVYLDNKFNHVSADDAELIKVFWDDGSISFLAVSNPKSNFVVNHKNKF